MHPKPPPLVIDTNVFVAALFREGSQAARLIDWVRHGVVRMVWNQETMRETRTIIERIPPIDWASVSELFQMENEYTEPTDHHPFHKIPDPDDRKFAALAYATGAILISQDDDLLGCPEQLEILVLNHGSSWKAPMRRGRREERPSWTFKVTAADPVSANAPFDSETKRRRMRLILSDRAVGECSID